MTDMYVTKTGGMQRKSSALFSVTLAALFAGLSGCSMMSFKDEPVAPKEDEIAKRLASSSERVAKAWEVLARVDVAKTPPIPSPSAARELIPAELNQIVQVAWSGPPAPVLKDLASKAGWRFEVMGRHPIQESVVSIQGEMEIITAIERIGSQINGARVRADGNTRTLSLIWITGASR